MNSLKNTVVQKFGSYGESVPEFVCPIVIAPPVLSIIKGSQERVRQLVNEAAQAVDLLAGFGDRSNTVDFAAACALSDGLVPVAMRAEALKTGYGSVVRIDVVPAILAGKAVH